MGERFCVFSKIIARNLPVPLNDVFVNHQALEAYGPPAVQPVRADAHLRAQAVAETVGKPVDALCKVDAESTSRRNLDAAPLSSATIASVWWQL